MSFDVSRVRKEFPALSITDDGMPRVYFDNPGGTQVPNFVIDRIRRCLVETNANLGGQFATSLAMGRIFDQARLAMADFLGAGSADEIIFGQNMTSLTFHISRCIGHTLEEGDEIVLTEMDHEGNVSPWLLVARDQKCTVRWLPLDPETYELDIENLERIVGPKTKVVALNYASNILGTINDIPALVQRVKALAPAAIVYVDAVQYAAHGLIDVQKLGCDMLVCSPYKFFGPHQGVLWGRREMLEKLDAYKARPSADVIPYRLETGTLGHESVAGVLGAIEYFEWLGNAADPESHPDETPRRSAIRRAWEILGEYETGLLRHLLDGLADIRHLRIHGITNPNALHNRVPTVAITHADVPPVDMARYFASRGIFVWSGHSYAIEATRRLGLLEAGGVLRVGLAHYNTTEEIDHFIRSLKKMPS